MADDYEVEVAELEAIKGGDQEAFSRWLARSEIRLRRSLQSFAQSVDVEVVVQEAAFRVWERASAITPDGRPAFLMRWAVTVALNAARNDAKRSRREVPPDADPEVPGPPDPILRVRIRKCVEQLPSSPQRVLDARRADDGHRSDRELAVSLGMTFNAFRQNLRRARHALKQCLRGFGIDVTDTSND